MTNEVRFGNEARVALLEGINLAANACKVTLGPKGRNVVIQQKNGEGKITKDGVEVISAVDPYLMTQNLGARLIAGASKKTAEEAGDGTTTAAILAQAIIKDGFAALEYGMTPGGLKAGIDHAVALAVKKLEEIAKPVRSSADIAAVGTVSANGDSRIGQEIAAAMGKVGNEGIITVEEGTKFDTEVDVVEGMQIDEGFVSPLFINSPEKGTVELSDPLIFVTERRLKYMRDVMPILEIALKAGRSLLIIADDVEGEVLPNLLLNSNKGILVSCAIKAPGVGDYRAKLLEDIAVLTGARVLREGMNDPLENFTIDRLGSAKAITVSAHTTIIVDGKGSPNTIKAQAEGIRLSIKDAPNGMEREFHKYRLAKLVGGVGVIRVGGKTTLEIKELTMRVEDALYATKAAVAEGIVPGGGIAYMSMSQVLLDLIDGDLSKDLQLHPMDPKGFKEGIRIVLDALNAPIKQLALNAGKDPEKLRLDVGYEQAMQQNPNLGYNVRSDEMEDLVKAAIVEPAKVVRCALQNAASIAGLVLTTEVLISYIPVTSQAQLF